MDSLKPVLAALILIALVAPSALLAVISVPTFLRRPLKEFWVGTLTPAALLVSFFALGAAGLVFLGTGFRPEVFSLGEWFSMGGGGFQFDLLVDGWSLGFALLSVGICGVVSAFSFRYLHREPGFHRYFILLIVFVIGLLLVSLAGSIEVLFAGWELVGLSSALLVAFFHERLNPVTNALRVFAVYRVGDACMLAAAVLIHHWAGSGSFSSLFSGTGGGLSALTPDQITLIAVLVIAASAAKSALLPFSGWLPRAMEGPTPSSAVYYGALSIHAGCFLLLRVSPMFEQSLTARVLAASAGIGTAAYAALAMRVQTDLKSRLSYASLTQVGFIVFEIACGWQTLAFIHMIGNACFRLLQFLSAPNILHDLHELENDLGGRLEGVAAAHLAAGGYFGRGVYLLALERGFLDSLMDRWCVGALRRAAVWTGRLDRALCGRAAELPAPESYDS